MKYSFEDARKQIVDRVEKALAVNHSNVRVKWPGPAKVDIAQVKSVYIDIDIVYQSGDPVGLGPTAPKRRIGTIVADINYKDGDPKAYILSNELMDVLDSALSDTDAMYPVRTYTSSPVTPPGGVSQGWVRQGLVTPFFFDTSR